MSESVEVYEDLDRHGGYILQAEGQVFHTVAEVEAAFPGAKIVIHHNLKLVPPSRDTGAREVDFDPI
jgi:hypothetical protein